jgi:predicted O-methyltransferase YrrM
MVAESEFTPPSEWCPKSYWWNSEDNESTELEVSKLVAAFVTGLQPDVVLETGSAFGETTYLIGKALQENNHGFCVSIEWDGARCDIAKKKCEGLPVQIWGGHSCEYPKENFGLQTIDFAWIDSGPMRGPEIRYYWDHFSKGAIIGVHDVGPQHAAVRNQIIELMDEGLIRPIFLRTPRGVCFAEILN